jgi:hypothetical protein
MWRWDQSAGELSHNGQIVARGYSGRGAGRNNPDMQEVRATGPIPAGRWRIGTPRKSDRTGPYAMNLTPIGHNAHGRDAFQIHGDNATSTASSGCVILNRSTRERIWNSGDHELEVIE